MVSAFALTIVGLSILASLFVRRLNVPYWYSFAAIFAMAGLPIALGPTPLASYSVTLLVIAVLLSLLHPAFRSRPSLVVVPVIIYMGFCYLVVWDGSVSIGTVVQYSLGPIAWSLGWALAPSMSRVSTHKFVLIGGISLVIFFQLIVAVGQLLGFDLFSTYGRTAELTANRANGTFSHPGTLGKALVCLVALLLPYTTSRSNWYRRIALAGVLCAFLAVLASQSRANTTAAVALLVLWVFLAPRSRQLSMRVIIPGILVVGALLFLEPILSRFLSDPSGGERERFTTVALAHIPDHFWFGVGPGNYVSYFGAFDSLTAEGWPVHNTYLLVVAELGVLGSLLIFSPMLYFAIITIIQFFGGVARNAFGSAYLAFFVAMLPVSLTGWGLISSSMWPLWFFASALLAGAATGRYRNANKSSRNQPLPYTVNDQWNNTPPSIPAQSPKVWLFSRAFPETRRSPI